MHATFQDCVREVTWFLGWGRRAYHELTVEQQTAIDPIMKAGLSRFYYPVMPDGTVYTWSFMQSPRQITLTAAGGGKDVLPFDVAGVVSDVYYQQQDGGGRILMVSEGRIRELRGESSSPGKPQLCAVVARIPHQQTYEQSLEIHTHPRPDKDYTVLAKVTYDPNNWHHLTGWPLGGQQHGDTLIAACLAAAEERMNDTRGQYAQVFAERLMASINADRQNDLPEFFGRLRDTTRVRDAVRRPARDWRVTYNE